MSRHLPSLSRSTSTTSMGIMKHALSLAILSVACASHDPGVVEAPDGGKQDSTLLAKPATATTSEPSATGDHMTDITQVRRMKLRFLDASVPPEFHRSYTIEVVPERVSVVVDVYGEVIARDERLLDPREWEELARAGVRLGRSELREAPAELTGTTETRLQIEWVDSAQEWSWGSGAQLEGDAGSSVARFVQRLEKLLPELPVLLQTPYPR